MKRLLLPILALLCFGCKPEHTTLPPGWKMTCDHKGHYAPMRPSGYVIHDYSGLSQDDLPYPSKQAAIDRAWGQFDFENEARPEARTPEQLGLSACED